MMAGDDDAHGCPGWRPSGASFEDWYRGEYRNIVRSLILITGNPEVAIESASEACARALESWDRVSMMDSPSGWTYMVGLNVARRALRRAKIEALVLRRPALPTVLSEPSPELWTAVRRLPGQQRVAVVLHYVADLSQKEVAAIMGVAEGTIGATLHAARKRLADVLGHIVETKEMGRE